MAFGNKMRAKRSHAGLLLGVLVGSMGMTTTLAPPAPATIVTSSVGTAPREFINEAPATKRAKPTVTNRIKGGKGGDSRKGRRRALMRLARTENSGRQWIRVRRAVRAGPFAWLLNIPAAQLNEIARTNTLILAPK